MINFIKELALKSKKVFESSQLRIVNNKNGSSTNWVTETDIAVEKFIIEKIKSNYPNHIIVAEESNLPALPENKDKIWIIDPLDGTNNATYGIPIYATSIAFIENGEIVRGVVLDVPNGKLYWAEKNKGAFVENTRLSILNQSIKGTIVASGAPYSREDYEVTAKLMDKVHQAGARLHILGSAVMEAMLTAEGKYSLYFETGLKPWDMAAVKLIIKEAGGVAESFEGQLDIFNSKTFVCGGKQAVEEFKHLYKS